jgi:hypothetical protein
MLERMGAVLQAHGSNPLREAIERHGPELLAMVDVETVQDCLEALRRADATDGVIA